VITGDVDFENVSKKQVYYSVPWNVGPMKINVLKTLLAKINLKITPSFNILE
jgi:5,10-methylene-tetrahydrofolate dehydrogenase/methenyl tetrahydrofolate cyclohydrolase